MTPTIPRPCTVIRLVSLMDEIPLMALLCGSETSRLMTVPTPSGLKRILHQNGDILVANRIDCRRIDHFRTEVTKLRSFHIAQFIDSVCPGNHTRVSCHESVYIRPDFQTVGIQCSSNDCRRIVRATSTQVRYLSRHFVCGDKTQPIRVWAGY